MATEYALRHRTSLRYLAADPRLGAHVETKEESAAFTWSTMTESILAQDAIEDYGAAWDAVPVVRADRPYPLDREGPRAGA